MPAKLTIPFSFQHVPDSGRPTAPEWPAFVRMLASNDLNRIRQTIGPVPEQLLRGEIDTLGWCIGVNLGPNTVYFRRGLTGDDVPMALPGDPFLFRASDNDMRAIAPAGSAVLDLYVSGV